MKKTHATNNQHAILQHGSMWAYLSTFILWTRTCPSKCYPHNLNILPLVLLQPSLFRIPRYRKMPAFISHCTLLRAEFSSSFVISVNQTATERHLCMFIQISKNIPGLLRTQSYMEHPSLGHLFIKHLRFLGCKFYWSSVFLGGLCGFIFWNNLTYCCFIQSVQFWGLPWVMQFGALKIWSVARFDHTKIEVYPLVN